MALVWVLRGQPGVGCGGNRGGTLAKLVERLTFPNHVNTHYMQHFLLTYRTFTTPTELLSLLSERADMPDPIRASDSQMEVFRVRAYCPSLHTREAARFD